MKYENEITVSVNISKEKLIIFLEKNNYKKLDSYVVDDLYYVLNDTNLNQKPLDVLKNCVLIRTICENRHYLLYKYKEYDDKEDIIKQGKSQVQVDNIEDSKTFLEAIGYKYLIHINDQIVVYEKDGLELCIEYVNDKYLYIEIEANEKYDTIEKLKKGLEKTNIDYDKSSYFVKKTKIVFEENYRNGINKYDRKGFTN